MIKIESGIPIPQNVGTRVSKYPYRDLKPGDSFFVALTENHKSASALRQTLQSGAIRALGKGAAIAHVVTENEVQGVRVWRV